MSMQRWIVLSFAVVSLFASSALAQTQWILPGPGDWSTVVNWSDGLPDAATDTIIDNGGVAQVLAAGAASRELRVGEGAANSGGVLIDGGSLASFQAFVGNADGSSGELLIRNAGSTWSVSDRIMLGRQGQGELLVESGGSVSASDIVLGQFAGGEGTARVSGLGSSLDGGELIWVGASGFSSGSLQASGGGLVTADRIRLGTLNVLQADIAIQDAPTVLIADELWLTNGSFTLTDAGAISVGEMRIADGSSAVVAEVSESALVANELFVGYSAMGTLVAETAAGMTSQTVVIGEQAGAEGLLSMTGTGTFLNVADNLYAGNTGIGTLSVTGSSVNITEHLYVGNSGSGILSLAAGAQAEARFAFLGEEEGAGAVASVTGSGSELTVEQTLYLAERGSATLSILEGGRIHAGVLQLGRWPTGQGVVSLSGENSRLSLTQFVNVGVAGGSGIISIDDQARLEAGGSCSLGSLGSGVLTVRGPSSLVRCAAGITENALFAARLGSAEILIADHGHLDLTLFGGPPGGRALMAEEENSISIMRIGDGGAPGTIAAASIEGGLGTAQLFFNHDASGFHFTDTGDGTGVPVLIGGSVTVAQIGDGTTILSGSHDYTGATIVGAGTLLVTGSISSPVQVLGGATLGGNGTVGMTEVFGGGRLAPGLSPGTLTTGTLVLDGLAMLDFELDSPAGVSDRIEINGDLVLNGTLNVSDLGGMAAGSYTLMTYTGTMTDMGLDVGSLPPGFTAAIDTSSAGQVDLIVGVLVPALEIVPFALDFGDIAVGQASAAQSVTLENTGAATLTISTLTPIAEPFERVGGSCPAGVPFDIGAGLGCTITIRFVPTALGGWHQTVEIGSNATPGLHSFQLTGNGLPAPAHPVPVLSLPALALLILAMLAVAVWPLRKGRSRRR